MNMKHKVQAILVSMVTCEINDVAEIFIYLGKCFKKSYLCVLR